MEQQNSAAEPSVPLVPGLTDPRALGLERCPIRTRESGVTRSGWRLSIESVEGSGAIVLVDEAEPALFRGDGIFLGWPRERLEAAYRALLPAKDERPFDIGQLG